MTGRGDDATRDEGANDNGGDDGDKGGTETKSTSESPEEHAKREAQMARALGEATWLLLASPAHRHLFLSDFEWCLIPALRSRQFCVFRKDGEPAGLALWAHVSETVDQRLAAAPGRLAPNEWMSGDILWLIDLVAPFGGQEEMLEKLATGLFKGRGYKVWKADVGGKPGVMTVDPTPPKPKG